MKKIKPSAKSFKERFSRTEGHRAPNGKGLKIQWRKKPALGVTENTGQESIIFQKIINQVTFKRSRIENGRKSHL